MRENVREDIVESKEITNNGSDLRRESGCSGSEKSDEGAPAANENSVLDTCEGNSSGMMESGSGAAVSGDLTGGTGEMQESARLEAAEKALRAAEERAGALEAELICLQNGVPAENAADVIALAKGMGGGNAVSGAIAAVLEKYPFFRAEGSSGKAVRPFATTGVHIEAAENEAGSGVEAAFRKSNPNVRL